MAWEVVSVALVMLIGLCFYTAFNMSDDPKHIIFKVFFMWFGFTLIMPFLWLCRLAIPAAETEARNLFRNLFVTYLPLYGFFVWIIFLAFFKDVLLFFKNAMGGLKQKEKEEYELR